MHEARRLRGILGLAIAIGAGAELAASPASWILKAKPRVDHGVNYAGFLDPARGITIGNNGDVRFTADGGATWTKARNKSACRFGLDIVDEAVAWNCGNLGEVRLSVDGGRTWKTVADYGYSEPHQCRYMRFLDASAGWIAEPEALAATSDGGATWRELPLPEGIGEIVALDLLDADHGALLDHRGAVFLTADGGRSFARSSIPLASGEEIALAHSPAAAMRFADPRRGIALFVAGGQARAAETRDGGRTWEVAPLDLGGIQAAHLFLAHDGRTLTVLGADWSISVWERTE